MPDLVGYLVLFLGVGVGFILVHLLVGKLIRPAKAHDDKLTIYECGEPTIGSAWVQFDLRYYVVALLFVIFDVEVAFFFPWAVVFGKTTELGRENLPDEQRMALTVGSPTAGAFGSVQPLVQNYPEHQKSREQFTAFHAQIKPELLKRREQLQAQAGTSTNVDDQLRRIDAELHQHAAAARHFSWIAFVDILVFFGVLLVGFAYLWKRGDLNWVRSTAAEQSATVPEPAARESLAAVS